MKRLLAILAALCLLACGACKEQAKTNDPQRVAFVKPEGGLYNMFANHNSAFAVTDGEALYYYDGSSVKCAKGDGSESYLLARLEGASHFCYDGGKIYCCEKNGTSVDIIDPKNGSATLAFDAPGVIRWLWVAAGQATYLAENEDETALYVQSVGGGEAEVLCSGSIDDAALAESGIFAYGEGALRFVAEDGTQTAVHAGSISALQAIGDVAYFLESRESLATVNSIGQQYSSSFLSLNTVGDLFAMSETDYVFTVDNPEGGKSLFYHSGNADLHLFSGDIQRVACFGGCAVVEYLKDGEACYGAVLFDGSSLVSL